jgi:hypothetical protein
MLARQHQGRALGASREDKKRRPNGATASRRTAPPGFKPVRMRPRTRSFPRVPTTDSSPSIDRNPLHAAVACYECVSGPGSAWRANRVRGGLRAATEK